MTVIRPKDEPAATTVAAGDIFLIDGATGVRGLDAATVLVATSSNVVTNAMAAQMSAATLKGNVTASLANAADFTIQGLASLAAPNSTLDFLPIYDHASGTIKKVTPVAIGAGLSILNFGAVNDAVSHSDGAITTGTRNFTSATGTFTANDVGKRIVIPGAGAAGAILETTISAFVSATAVTLTATAGTTVSGRIYYYGTDNTTAIQNAINQAQATGDEVRIPGGSWITSSTLNVGARCGLRGVGYQGDSGAVYNGAVVTKATGWLGSTLICGNFNAITVGTNDPVRIEGIQIVYPSQPNAGTTGITGNSGAGSTSANSYSVIRDVCIFGADFGISLTDWYDFKIDNCNIGNHYSAGIQLAPQHYPSFGDATIVNCTIASGSASHHIAVLSGGGLRIENNKLNYGAPVSQGIVIAPNLNVGAFIEPFLIVGNSIEGQQQGILFVRSSGNTLVSQVVITGNQIWVGTNCVQTLDNSGAWINGVTISGNFLCNATTGANILDFGGVQNVTVNGNAFSTSAANAVAINIGTNATNIAQKGNTFPSIVTMIQDAPVPTVLTSGSGTYNTPANAKYLLVEGVGGGGGGAGSGTSPAAATAGGNTTFGTLTGNGGALGSTSAGTSSTGGTATGGDENQSGGNGGGGTNQVNNFGGAGGNSRFGGAGLGGLGSTGTAAAANSGSGGGGAGCGNTVNSGGGGAAGGYFKKLITLPAATYAYAIGSAGSAGGAGTGGSAGSAGAAGKVVVTAYF